MRQHFVQMTGLALAAVWLAGCGGGQRSTAWDDLKKLQTENSDMALQVEQLQAENTQLHEQVQTLSGLDKRVRLDALDTLAKIRIGRYTGLYDKDEDGAADSLVVYVQPMDTAQDYIKAVGVCTVEVWNLNAPDGQAKLAEWTVEPDQLHKNWGGTIFIAYYRLVFPIGDLPLDKPDELTIKVTFTDFLTGKVFSGQHVITTSPLKL
jgi:hypothetical protein